MDIFLLLKSVLPLYQKNFKSIKIGALDIDITMSNGKVFKLTKDELEKFLKEYGFSICD